MRREHIQSLFERRRAASGRHDSARLARLHSESGRLESPAGGASGVGWPAIERVYEAWFTELPGFMVARDELLVQVDRAIEVFTIAGKATGGIDGLSPTHTPFQLPMINLCTLNDEGHIVHERRADDFTGLLLQISLLEAEPA